MVTVGCHVSIAGSIRRSVDRAAALGCDTFQIFSRNPRGWKFRDLDEEVIEAFREKLRASGIDPVIDHMPYLPNLGSPKREVYEKSLTALAAELKRCGMLGIPYLVTHLGSHLGSGIEEGRRRECEAINTALAEAGNGVMLLLENTAGTKNSIGGTFEEIRSIMDGIDDADRIGICFDTCHAFAAGYDLSTVSGFGETVDRFRETIGTRSLRCIHLNDSKGDLDSRLDRHEHIGLGHIREEGFRRILRHKDFRDLPFILETPVDSRRDDAGNIRLVRQLAE